MNDYKAFIPSKINYNWGWNDTDKKHLKNKKHKKSNKGKNKNIVHKTVFLFFLFTKYSYKKIPILFIKKIKNIFKKFHSKQN